MIFIAGNSRSGTTMMGRILGNHPGVFTFQELHFFDEICDPENLFLESEPSALKQLAARLMSVQRDGYFNRSSGKAYAGDASDLVDRTGCKTPAEVYEAFVTAETQLNKKSVPCEQTPQNIFDLKDIFRIFPHARVVLMIRDPREVLLSQKNKWKRRQYSGSQIPFTESLRARLNYHPVTISKIWNAVATEIRIFESDPRVLVVRYEDLLTASHKTITSICDHCNLIFHDNMLDIPAVGSSLAPDANRGTTGIDPSRTGNWKKGLSPTEASICQEINGYEMVRWGYVPETVSASPLGLLWNKVTMPVKLALAIPFNLHRLRKPGQLIKRLF